jgi:DNA-directed RNA polymerase specialized sigma24 family protein
MVGAVPDAQQVDAAADVAVLLSGLTAVLAMAVVAVHLHGYGVARVARVMGVSRFRIRRAMRELQVKAASTSAAKPVLHS